LAREAEVAAVIAPVTPVKKKASTHFSLLVSHDSSSG